MGRAQTFRPRQHAGEFHPSVSSFTRSAGESVTEQFFTGPYHMPGPMLVTKAEVQTRSSGSLPCRADTEEAGDTVQCDRGKAGSAEVELNPYVEDGQQEPGPKQ